MRQDAKDRTEPHPHQPRRQSRNPQQTEQSRTDRRGGTALLTGGLLVRIQPEEPPFLGNSTTFAGARSRVRARYPFFAVLHPICD